jgi:hypothetical protein
VAEAYKLSKCQNKANAMFSFNLRAALSYHIYTDIYEYTEYILNILSDSLLIYAAFTNNAYVNNRPTCIFIIFSLYNIYAQCALTGLEKSMDRRSAKKGRLCILCSMVIGQPMSTT